MFPCMIVEAETLDVLSNGMDGTKNGSMQLVYVSLHCVDFLEFVIFGWKLELTGNLIMLFRCMLRFNYLLHWFRSENIISSGFASSMLKAFGQWLMFRSTLLVMVPTGTLT
jgi:hypothetical protein